MQRHIVKLNAKRGAVYTSPKRAIGVAASGRSPGQIILVTDLTELKRALNVAGAAKFVGNGLVALDVVNRGTNIINAYAKNDGSGYRTQFKESTVFAASGIAGLGIAALADGLVVGLAMGPVGWAIVIGIGIAASIYVGVNVDCLLSPSGAAEQQRG